MKKIIKILIVIIILCMMFFVIDNAHERNTDADEIFKAPNMVATKRAVVVKVNEKSLSVMGIEDTNDLCSVSFAEEGNIGFKQGQEVLIYFNGMIAESYPAQIHHVGKIEIVKEKSDITIPESVLKFYYSSRNNVTISISELTTKGISFTITYTNELPYNYSNTYTIYKKNKQTENKEPAIVQPATSNSTAPYMGSGQVLWQEAKKVSNVSAESTVQSFADAAKHTYKKICDWTNVYGKLGERRI